MRKTSWFSVVLLWALLPAGPVFAKNDLRAGLVLSLDFERGDFVEDAGKTFVRDPGRATVRAEVHGARPAPGKRGEGVMFDGDDWLDTQITQNANHRAFSFWARAAKLPQKDVIPFGTMNDESRIYIGFPPENDTVGVGNGATSYYGKGVPFHLDTQWHNYVVNRAGKRAALYIDGRKLLDVPDGVTEGAGIYYVGAINKFHLNHAAMHFFTGTMDEIRIWDRALDPEEIAALASGDAPTEEPLPAEVKDILYPSTADASQQPALFYAPDSSQAKPLLVGLHTWSFDYQQKPNSVALSRWCIEKGWAFIHPNFRGRNVGPDATGSEKVVADILSAVQWAKKQTKIDARRIYVVGNSGGGYAALLMAGRAPKLWAGVSAWVPISDLNKWYDETKQRALPYAEQLSASCGGDPSAVKTARAECAKRSAITYLKNAQGVNLDINAGIHDGHNGASVPISQSFDAFNALASKKDKISNADVALFTNKQEVPEALRATVDDPLYGDKRVLFRRTSGKARLTIFDGAHDIVFEAALDWLSRQRKK
jgi:dienelactone hydrolase